MSAKQTIREMVDAMIDQDYETAKKLFSEASTSITRQLIEQITDLEYEWSDQEEPRQMDNEADNWILTFFFCNDGDLQLVDQGFIPKRSNIGEFREAIQDEVSEMFDNSYDEKSDANQDRIQIGPIHSTIVYKSAINVEERSVDIGGVVITDGHVPGAEDLKQSEQFVNLIKKEHEQGEKDIEEIGHERQERDYERSWPSSAAGVHDSDFL